MELWAGAHDPLSARIAQQAGFDRIWLGGYGLSAALLGLPDAGFLTPEHYIDALTRIRNVCDIPIVLDAEGGFGRDIDGIAELARRFAEAGAGTICVEDTAGPKRSSLWTGFEKTLRPAEEMAHLVEAVVSACEPFGTAVIGRTESLILGRGVDETVRRIDMYAAAGASAVLPHFRDSVDEVLEVGRRRGKQLRIVIIPTRAPTLSVEDLEAAGFSIFIASNVAVRSAAMAMRDSLAAVVGERRLRLAFDRCLTVDELDAIVDRDRLVER